LSARGSLLSSRRHLHLRERVAGRLHLLRARLSGNSALLGHDFRGCLHGRPQVACTLLHATALSEALESLLRALLLRDGGKLCGRRRSTFGLRRKSVERLLAKLLSLALLLTWLVEPEKRANALRDDRRERRHTGCDADRKWIDCHGFS
jgi:hypothetical protein